MQAEEKQTSINNMDKNTFTRFVKFIYKNDYNVAEALIIFNNLNTKRRRSESPSPKSLKVDAVDPPYLNDILTTNPPPQTKIINHSLVTPKKNRKRDIQIPIRNRLPSFANFSFPTIDNISFPEIYDHGAVSDIGLIYNYTKALCHVQLYIFTEKY